MTRVIEADETGRLVLPIEVLGEAKPHGRYTVETAGMELIVKPVSPPNEADLFTQDKLTPEEWLKQWRELSEEIGKVWPEGVSAADVIAEMRR